MFNLKVTKRYNKIDRETEMGEHYEFESKIIHKYKGVLHSVVITQIKIYNNLNTCDSIVDRSRYTPMVSI